MAKFAGLRDPVTLDFEGSTAAYCVDAFSISMGALVGSSPVTAFIESATGISGTSISCIVYTKAGVAHTLCQRGARLVLPLSLSGSCSSFPSSSPPSLLPSLGGQLEVRWSLLGLSWFESGFSPSFVSYKMTILKNSTFQCSRNQLGLHRRCRTSIRYSHNHSLVLQVSLWVLSKESAADSCVHLISIAYGLIAGFLTYISINFIPWALRKLSNDRIVPPNYEASEEWTVPPGSIFPSWL